MVGYPPTMTEAAQIDAPALKQWLRQIALEKGHRFNWEPDEAPDEVLGQCPSCLAMWHLILRWVPERSDGLLTVIGAGDFTLRELREGIVKCLDAIMTGLDCQGIQRFRETVYGGDRSATIYCVGLGKDALGHVSKTSDPLRPPEVVP